MPPTPIPDVGDQWLVNFGPPVPGEAAGVHPALIVAPQSPLICNSAIPVSVVPLTSRQRPGMSTRVAIEPTDVSGLTDESYAQCEYVQSVSRSGLIETYTSRRHLDNVREGAWKGTCIRYHD